MAERVRVHMDRFPLLCAGAQLLVTIIMAKWRRLPRFESVCVFLFANLHRMAQHVVRSLLLSRILVDAPLASKRSSGSGMDSSRAG